MDDSPPPHVHMTWSNLLFVHWRVPPELLRPLIPEELTIDTFDGSAWLGLVPFEMTDTSFRRVPPLPGLARFYECNLRTYVRHGDHAGVWFFSLDAARLLPVLGGRWLWSLNYVHARFRVSREGERTSYNLKRRRGWGRWPGSSTNIVWTRGDALPQPEPGSLEHFLTERYMLFTKRRGRLMHGRVAHDPWSIRAAELISLDDSLVQAAGIDLGDRAQTPDHIMMADSIVTRGYELSL